MSEILTKEQEAADRAHIEVSLATWPENEHGQSGISRRAYAEVDRLRASLADAQAAEAIADREAREAERENAALRLTGNPNAVNCDGGARPHTVVAIIRGTECPACEATRECERLRKQLKEPETFILDYHTLPTLRALEKRVEEAEAALEKQHAEATDHAAVLVERGLLSERELAEERAKCERLARERNGFNVPAVFHEAALDRIAALSERVEKLREALEAVKQTAPALCCNPDAHITGCDCVGHRVHFTLAATAPAAEGETT